MGESLRVMEMFFRRATILDLISLDLPCILSQDEDSKKIVRINDKIKFVDYSYTLQQKELGIFDKLTIRMFNDFKSFDSGVHTHITLTASREFATDTLVKAVDKLIDLYDEDETGAKEIQKNEMEMLHKRDFWHGRTWNFNKDHGLWKISHPEEQFTYSVTINYDSLEGGFTLSIFGFNKLCEMFGMK